MTFIAFVDLISVFVTLLSIIILFIKWRQTTYPDIRYLLQGLLSLSFFYYLFLFLEWSGISGSFEKTEDLLGALIPMFWAFIFYSFLQLIAKKDLQNSEEKYRQLIQNSGDIIFLIYQNKFEVVNKKFEEVFNLTIDDVNQPDFNMKQLLLSKSHADFKNILTKINDKDQQNSIYHLSIRNARGEEVEVEASFNFIEYEEGRALQGIMRDLTDRKRLEEQLRQSQKMEAIGQLAGGVAHDFNNILTIINGYSEILLKSKLPTSLENPIREIRSAGIRASRLTSQLLAFSRKQIIQPKLLNLNDIISDQIKMLGRLLGEDVEISTIFDPHLRPVKADPGQIEQVVMNISINARDAMPTGGNLRIETKNVEFESSYAKKNPDVIAGKFSMLSFSDTGIGMDATTLSRIFEPFYTTKGRDKGTGLGLSTVYGVIKQNNGFIHVYSEIQQGTVFKIYFPSEERRVKQRKTKLMDESELKGTETILLVEDDASVRSVTESTLTEYGYKVISASNGEEAIRVYEENKGKFNLLLTDVVMPLLSGRELAEKLTEQDKKLKVLYFSGYTDDSNVRHGILSEGMQFIQKPYSHTELAKKIRTVLSF